MTHRFKYSLFGGNRDEKNAKAPSNQEAQLTLPDASAEPVSETFATAAQPIELSTPPVGSPSAAELEALFPSENTASETIEHTPATQTESADTAKEARAEERRRKRRARISTPVRVRSLGVTEHSTNEITTTLNVSRIGILIETASTGFVRNMEVAVTLPYSKTQGFIQAEQEGRVMRVTELPNGRRSVAVALGMGVGDLINSAGQKLELEAEQKPVEDVKEREFTSNEDKYALNRTSESTKPLVLAIDAEGSARDSIKEYLTNQGYDVIAVSSAGEAREVLNLFTPALLIAEIEGEGMPGYDLCAHCKATPRLQKIPVMLMTSSAYPSDYASAHSLGAVVCMAKPFKQERLGHVVRLLAPPPDSNNETVPPRPADPTRRHGRTPSKAPAESSSAMRRFRFGGKF
jgi:CheY-like chemotaxis protein